MRARPARRRCAQAARPPRSGRRSPAPPPGTARAVASPAAAGPPTAAAPGRRTPRRRRAAGARRASTAGRAAGPRRAPAVPVAPRSSRVLRSRAERRVDVLAQAVALDVDLDLVARLLRVDDARQLGGVVHRLAVDALDHVVVLEAGLVGGPARRHVLDLCAVLTRGVAGGLDAEVGVLDGMAALELGHDLPRHVRRDREADADVAAARARGRDL